MNQTVSGFAMGTQSKIPPAGLHILHEPEQSDSALIDVVFVHGFGGHPMRSWQYDGRPTFTRPKTSAQTSDGPRKFLMKKSRSSESLRWTRSGASPLLLWPRDLLPGSCPEARIMTWGYRSLHSGSMPVPVQPDLFSHVNTLLRDLVNLRQGTSTLQRPLVFIAHSLGGIIVKEALCQAQSSEMKSEHAILSSTAAVVFFGCPHRTVERESIRDAVVSMAQATLSVETERPILSALCGVDNPRWSGTQKRFLQLWHHFNFVVKTYQETQSDNHKPTNHRFRLSELGSTSENAETLSADHHTMCQFKSTSDPGFHSTEKLLKDILEDEKAKRRGLSATEKSCLEQLVGTRDCSPPSAKAKFSPGTCRRICNSRELSSWYHRQGGSNRRVLWLTGAAGSGKSTQLQHLRCRLETEWEPDTTLIISCTAEGQSLDRDFMSPSNGGKMQTAATIRCILSQLFAQDPNLRRSLALREGCVDDADLIRFFLDDYATTRTRTLTRRTFILVDAQSTCDDGYIRDLLYCLCQMARNSDFSVCLASEPINGDTPVDIIQLELEHHNLEDIVGLVQSRLRATWEERYVVVRKVAKKARGKFLWAQLATNLLNEVIDGGGAQDLVDQVLGELPVDLFGLYEWIIGTLSSKEKAEATIIMRWAMLSAKPMTLNDLCMAVRLGRTHFLVCSDPITALDVGSPWSLQDLQRTGKHFDTPSRFYEWLRSRTRGLLRVRTIEKGSKAQKSLGLQHVHPIHPTVKSFFLSGRGFAALSAGRVTTIRPNHEAVDFCHYSLLRTILMYLNTSDPQPPVSVQASSLEMSPTWHNQMAGQRHVVTSQHPFLQYAVDNLLYHLLSPRALRYFLPQQAIFNTLTSHDCRIWRRWTALLGETDALAIMARCKSADRLLRPEFGSSFRLERVFRAVQRIATGSSWFSIPKNPKLIPGTSGGNQVDRQKLESLLEPPSLHRPRTTHRGARSRGTVVMVRKR